jgi:hypothetical protein
LNKYILHKECQDFIFNCKEDLSTLAFAGSPFENITIQELLQQIEGRRKIEKKLPIWHEKQGIYYPPKLNLEQTSSEITANYKASLINGASLADLTGGFGVDSFYFSKRIGLVDHYETNKALSEIAKYNFEKLDAKNVNCYPLNGISEIKDGFYNIIYLDPSRRHDHKGKVFYLADCEPNVPSHLSYLLGRCGCLLIKTSPMLDLTIGMTELKGVIEIHIVAINNEVKELLWLVKSETSEIPKVKTINFTNSGTETFEFLWNTFPQVEYGIPKQFLYEPNAAIMKSGAFNLVATTFGLGKLHKNSHLYTGDSLIDFPGRRFVIEQVVPYSKKEVKAALTFTSANITTRNFPESVASLRKKFKLKEGGSIYTFFTTIRDDEKVMLVCKKAEF